MAPQSLLLFVIIIIRDGLVKKGGLTTDTLPKATEAFMSSTKYQLECASWNNEEESSSCQHGLLSTIQIQTQTAAVGKSWRIMDWFFAYRLLLQRAFKSCIRNPGNLLARVACNVFVGFAAGLIFFQVRSTADRWSSGSDDASYNDDGEEW